MPGYVGPEHWRALRDRSPATADEWCARLGGGGAARLAVTGAENRGRLVDDGAGRLALVDDEPAQLVFGLQGAA